MLSHQKIEEESRAALREFRQRQLQDMVLQSVVAGISFHPKDSAIAFQSWPTDHNGRLGLAVKEGVCASYDISCARVFSDRERRG